MGTNAGWARMLGIMLVTLQPIPALAGGDEVRSGPELTNLVLQDCGSCHGMTLKGGLGPPLRPENLDQLPAEAIAAIIREGVPDTAMPAWKPLLTPGEIDWISRQLKSGTLISPQ